MISGGDFFENLWQLKDAGSDPSFVQTLSCKEQFNIFAAGCE